LYPGHLQGRVVELSEKNYNTDDAYFDTPFFIYDYQKKELPRRVTSGCNGYTIRHPE